MSLRHFNSILSLFLSLASSSLGQDTPHTRGPHLTRSVSFNSSVVSDLTHHLDVWAPDEAGSFPVVLFQSGFAGTLKGTYHSIVLDHIASHGFVILAPWTLDPANLLHDYYGGSIVATMSWAKNNLLFELVDIQGFHSGLDIDFDTLFFSAHSSGNHILVNNIRHYGCDTLKGYAMLSPVDGLDPMGMLPGYCITPGKQLNFETPILLMAAGHDWRNARPESPTWPACAPDELSNHRYWNATKGVGFFINHTDYGHADFQDPIMTDMNLDINFCATSDPAPDFDLYRSYTAGQIVAFFKGLLGDCSMFNYLREGAQLPVRTSMMQRGDASAICGNGHCNWEPLEDIWRP